MTAGEAGAGKDCYPSSGTHRDQHFEWAGGDK
jgi:hypothetical protein